MLKPKTVIKGPPALYLFRFATTGEVVPSKTQVLKLRDVQENLHLPPSKLRKDIWKPIAVVTGFNNTKTSDIVWHSLFTYPKPIRDKDWITTPVKKREAKDKDQAVHKISALCRILTELPSFKDDSRVFPEGSTSLDLKILWETPYWKNLVSKQELEWPEYIKHDKLDLNRGRIILNEGLCRMNNEGSHLARLGKHKKLMRANKSKE